VIRFKARDGGELMWRYAYVVGGGKIQREQLHHPAAANPPRAAGDASRQGLAGRKSGAGAIKSAQSAEPESRLMAEIGPTSETGAQIEAKSRVQGWLESVGGMKSGRQQAEVVAMPLQACAIICPRGFAAAMFRILGTICEQSILIAIRGAIYLYVLPSVATK